MQKFQTTLAVLIVIAIPAFARSIRTMALETCGRSALSRLLPRTIRAYGSAPQGMSLSARMVAS
jgi:hypothetical protein